MNEAVETSYSSLCLAHYRRQIKRTQLQSTLLIGLEPCMQLYEKQHFTVISTERMNEVRVILDRLGCDRKQPCKAIQVRIEEMEVAY